MQTCLDLCCIEQGDPILRHQHLSYLLQSLSNMPTQLSRVSSIESTDSAHSAADSAHSAASLVGVRRCRLLLNASDAFTARLPVGRQSLDFSGGGQSRSGFRVIVESKVPEQVTMTCLHIALQQTLRNKTQVSSSLPLYVPTPATTSPAS